jgi:hypothetical protein
VGTAAVTIGKNLSPAEAHVLAIQLEDAEKRLDRDQLVELVQAEAPGLTVDDIDRIAADSWTRANRRALESAFVVAVLAFGASTFLRRRHRRPPSLDRTPAVENGPVDSSSASP